MPFGLKNTPATFQKAVAKILEEFLNEFVTVYIDDIIIYSKTLKEHHVHLDKVFKSLLEHKLKLGADKCEIAMTRIDILGHTIEDR